MKKLNDDDHNNLWRGWIRIWVVLIPIWIASLIAVWFLIDEFLYMESSLENSGITLHQLPDEGIDMSPASGPEPGLMPGPQSNPPKQGAL